MPSLDLSNLNTALGAYYRENQAEIWSRCLNSLESPNYFRHYAGVVDEQPLNEVVAGDITQPYQSQWTPRADAISFENRTLKVRAQKIDLEINPHDLRASYLGYLTQNNIKTADFPFEAFIFDEIIKKIAEEIEMKLIWSGVYAAPTPGTPGAPETGIDGLKKIIADEIVATRITPVTTGVISLTNVITAFEDTFDGLAEALKQKEGWIFCAPDIGRMYDRKYRNEYGSNNNYNEFGRATLDGTNYQIVPVPGLSGSQRLVATTRDNIAYGYNGTNDHDTLETQLNRRVLDIIGDYLLGVQITQLAHLSVNDQA